MLFLRSWLEKYVTLNDITDAELADKITLGSSEVEEVTRLKEFFNAKVVIGRIENVRKHENADRLQVFDVYLGQKGKRQIVSAAPNVREGLIVPVALEGATLPYFTIANRSMRGVESQGMCLGKSELMLETKPSSGLWELESELQSLIPNVYSSMDEIFGQSICEIFPKLFPEDVIYEIKVLPNRMTEIGHHLGMAREIAILFGDKVTRKQALLDILDENLIKQRIADVVAELPASSIQFKLQDKVDYVNAFSLFDINLTEEYYLPAEYQRAMFLTGKNMVGSIADLTNYFSADFGQPTHIFGADKVVQEGGALNWVVDKVTTPRPFKGLGNLKDALLPAGIPVLYGAENPENILSLPAISGSDSSKADFKQKRFLLEVANFDGDDVGQACFDLRYRSEGSRMWIGGVNKALIGYTLLALLEESTNTEGFDVSIAGMYQNVSNSVITDKENITELLQDYCTAKQPVTIDWDYIARRFDGGSTEDWKNTFVSTLEQVGRLDGDNFYPDVFFSNISKQNDVLEELIRLVDYDDLRVERIKGSNADVWDTTYESLLKLKKKVAEYGFQEVITRPFVSEEHLQEINEEKVIRVLKPYNSLMPFVRDNLVCSLLISLSENIQRGEKNPLIFELGLVYRRNGNVVDAPRELTLAGVYDDPYRFTSAVQEILGIIHKDASGEWIENTNERGKCWELKNSQGVALAEIREVANSRKKIFGIPLNKPVFVAAIPLDVEFPDFHYNSYTDETSFPVVRRSYSFVVDKSIQFGKVFETVTSLEVRDDVVMITKPVERMESDDSNDILNIDILFKSYERTLDGDEIKEYEDKLFDDLAKLGNIKLR